MKRTFSTLALVAATTLGALSGSARADDWATLKVKFVFEGDKPKLSNIDGSRDPYCAELEIPDESLVIGEDGGIANMGFILKEAPKIHPDLVDPPAEAAVLDNDGCIFKPRVFTARAGQEVTVKNSDQTGHNAKSDFFSNPSRNDMIPIGGEVTFKLVAAERANANPIECSIHPWMKAFIIVRDHPYVGISNEKGELVIENLPAGKLEFRIWHESANRSIDEGKLNGKKEKWRRGDIEVDLKPGMNDLGTITLTGDVFKVQ